MNIEIIDYYDMILSICIRDDFIEDIYVILNQNHLNRTFKVNIILFQNGIINLK